MAVDTNGTVMVVEQRTGKTLVIEVGYGEYIVKRVVDETPAVDRFLGDHFRILELVKYCREHEKLWERCEH